MAEVIEYTQKEIILYSFILVGGVVAAGVILGIAAAKIESRINGMIIKRNMGKSEWDHITRIYIKTETNTK